MSRTKTIVTEIKEDTEQLKERLTKQEEVLQALNKGAVEKARRYDEETELKKKVKIKVSKIEEIFTEQACYGVKVEYKIDPVIIMFDSDGTPLVNERFKAMNLLNLTSFSDMQAVAKQINETTKKNKKLNGD